MMEKNIKASLVKEIEKLLGNYLGNRDAENFCKKITGSDKVQAISEMQQSESNSQINLEVPIGSSEREFIQSIVTFAGNNISNEYFNKLLLELSHLMIFNGELNLALELLDDLLAKIQNNPEYDNLKADANLALAKIAWSQAYWNKSVDYVYKSYEIFRQTQDLRGFAKCENMLGSIRGEQGDILKAQKHFQNGIKYLEDIDDPALRTMFEINLGVLYNMQGDHTKALWNLRNALQTCLKLNDLRKVSRIRHNLGMIYSRINDYQAALEEFEKSINLAIDNGYLSTCAIGYLGKAFVYTKLNNTDLAEAYTDKALEIAYKINDTLSIADVYRIKGMIQSNLDNFELSEEMFENSIRLNEDLDNKYNEAESSIELSKLYQKTDKPNEATQLQNKAVGYYDLVKAKSYIDNLLDANSN